MMRAASCRSSRSRQEWVAEKARGELEMTFEVGVLGRTVLSHLYRQVPLIVQQELYFDSEWPDLPCVYILSSGGPQVEGDYYRQRIELRCGAVAHISTGAATKVAEMTRGGVSVDTLIHLADNAYLEWLPEPTILCRGSNLQTSTRLVVAESATLFHSEIYMAGRKHRGELWEFDGVSALTVAERPDGRRLWVERQRLHPTLEEVRCVGVMGDYDVWACVTILTPRECADRIYEAVESTPPSEHAPCIGITRLPHDVGLSAKVLGRESGEVKRVVRELCDRVRRVTQGRALPAEFPWR